MLITILISLVVILFFLSGANFYLVKKSRASAESEIAKLTVGYALGTDAIGLGNLQEAKSIYRECFTQDAILTVIFPDGASETRTGTDAWADLVYSIFQKNGYIVTHHLMGTINISVQNNKAMMSSYLYATHKRSETNMDVANGIYEDEVIKKKNGGWKIRRRTLKLITWFELVKEFQGAVL